MPQPLWSEQEPGLWWDGAVAAIRSVLASSGVAGDGRVRHRLDRPDARRGAARSGGRDPAAGDPLERPADGRRMRGDPPCRWSGAVDLDHRQRCAHWFHGPQARLGPRQRAGGLEPGRSRPAAEGLPPLAPHRRLRHRQGGRCWHVAVRPGRPRLVAGGPRGARDRSGVAARDVRRADRHGIDHGAGGRGDGPPGGHAGRRRWRRPGRERRRASAPSRRESSPCRWGRLASSSRRRTDRCSSPPAGSMRSAMPCPTVGT